MSQSTSHGRRRRRSTSASSPEASDRAIYAGLLLIGLFAVLLAVPFTGGLHWQEVAIGYLIAMAFLVHLYAVRAWRGGHLARWQAALARLPLRPAGYGVRGSKPLEAARGQQRAMHAILVSIAISVVVITVLSVWLIGGR